MIDKENLIKTLLERVKKLPIGHCLDLRSYKRNRSVFVIREADDQFLILENGFFQREFHANFAEIRKLFKKILRQEFPRSHKIRLYNIGPYDPEKVAEIKRKKI